MKVIKRVQDWMYWKDITVKDVILVGITGTFMLTVLVVSITALLLPV
jgi:hypothetical protein